MGQMFNPRKGRLEDQRRRNGPTSKSATVLSQIGNTLRYVRFFDDFRVLPIDNIWTDT